MPPPTPRPHERRETGIEPALFVLLAAVWGSSYVFIKIGVETLPVFSLVAWRLAFGAASPSRGTRGSSRASPSSPS
jgi:drug/metabolite transporter (DMT)-like permease